MYSRIILHLQVYTRAGKKVVEIRVPTVGRMVLVILEGLKKNCVVSSGRFGLVGPKTAMEGLVNGQGVLNQRKIILTRTVPFFPGGI
jgi:hypothetical protein